MKTFLKSAFAALVVALTFSPVMAAGVSPTEVSGTKTVTAAEAKALFDKGAIFVDVRKNSDWDAGRVPEAEHLELKKVFTQGSFGKIAKVDDPIVIYCNGEKCLRSSKACIKSVAWGYKNIYYFRDGFPAWKSAGYPTE